MNKNQKKESCFVQGQEKNIQWHPAFCSAVELELLANKGDLIYEREYNLSRKPLQADLLVIKKADHVVIQNELGRIFSRDNIMEFKSPRDGLNANDYFKVLAYACLYKAQGEAINELKSNDVTISLVRDIKPEKLMWALGEWGKPVIEYVPGIYYVENAWFQTQIIVTSELRPDEHQWIRALTGELSKDRAMLLLDKASEAKGKEIEDLVDSVMTVSMAANKKIFEEMKGESDMYKFMEIWMGDEIQKRVDAAAEKAAAEAAEKAAAEAAEKAAAEAAEAAEKAAAEAAAEAAEKAAAKAAKRMLKRGRLTHEEIAEDFDLTIEEVESLAKEVDAELQTA